MGEVTKLETLNQMLNENTEFAVSKFKASGEIVPLFIGYRPSGARFVVAAPFNTDEEKRRNLNLIKLVFAAKECNRYVAICESWFAQSKDRKIPQGRIADRSDKREGVVILARSRNKSIGNVFEVIRGDGGTIESLNAVAEGVKFDGGSFTELLPPDKLNRLDVKKAEAVLDVGLKYGFIEFSDL